MNQTVRITTIVAILAAMLAACSRSEPATEPAAEQPADAAAVPSAADEPLAPAPAAPLPETAAAPAGSMVVYACDDGSGVTVTYDKHSALVKLPTGSTTLSKADPESPLGPNAYLSEEMTLSRSGNSVRLQVAGKSHTCTGQS